MTSKAKIKVIKKNELENKQAPAPVQINTKKQAAREVVSTVSDWVTDFQLKRRDETKQAFEKFFLQHPQTSGV